MIIFGVKLYCEIMDKPYLYLQSYRLNILKRSSFGLYIMHYFKGALCMFVFIPILYTNFHFCELVYNPHHVIYNLLLTFFYFFYVIFYCCHFPYVTGALFQTFKTYHYHKINKIA